MKFENLIIHIIKIVTAIAIYAVLAFVFMRKPAKAQVIDSSFYNWTVYEISADEANGKKCYIVSHPIKSDSDHNSRQKPYVMIARFQDDRSEEVSVFSGYEYKLNSQIFVLSDNYQFKLYAKKDVAWAITKSEDVKVISTMLNSGSLKVRSDSAFGTYGVDKYSLKGITRAYARMREICK